MLIDIQTRAIRALERTAKPPPNTAGSGPDGRHRVVVIVIGVAVVARLARDTRSYEPVIVAAIALGAAAALGRASRERSLTRLAAWDKRRNAKELC